MPAQADFCLLDWEALGRGMDGMAAWTDWASRDEAFPQTNAAQGTPAEQPKILHIPMMVARRMSEGAKYAAEASLRLFDKHSPTALVCSSRHGEIERTLLILQSIAAGTAISPTDFTMSVHNAASGQLTITAKKPIPTASIAAGADSFQQALYEVRAFLSAGHRSVLHVDFETNLPSIYQASVNPLSPAYAVAFLWGKSDVEPKAVASGPAYILTDKLLPQSLAFLRAYVRRERTFAVPGTNCDWLWRVSGE